MSARRTPTSADRGPDPSRALIPYRRAAPVPKRSPCRLATLLILLISLLEWLAAVGAELHAAPGPIRNVTRLAGRRGGSLAECCVAADGPRLYVAGHTDDFSRDPSLHLFRSEDGGRSWGVVRLGRDYDTLAGFRADPSVVVPAPGEVVVCYVVVSQGRPFAIVVARSVDGGATFAPPLYLVREPGVNAIDKPFLSVGRGAGGVPLVFVAYSRLGRENVAPGVWLALSRDRGETFEEPRLIEATAELSSYAMGAADGAGRVYVLYTRIAGEVTEIRLAESRDDGAHFDPPVTFARTGMGFRMSTPAAPHRGVGSVPAMVVDTSPRHPGRILVSWVRRVPGSTTETELLCRYSDPAPRLAERTWSAPVPVGRPDRGSRFHGWPAIDPETGTMAIVLHASGGASAPSAVDTWLCVSADGGDTWSEERISEVPSDVTRQPGAAPPDYLEYIGVAVEKGVAHAAWAGAWGEGASHLLEYQLRSVPLADVLEGGERRVPADYPTPGAALAAAEAGDRVVLDAAAGPFAGPITPPAYVLVTSAPGPRATIDAGGAPEAVVLPVAAPGAGLSRLRLAGFRVAGVRLGASPAPESGDFEAIPAATMPPLRLTDVAIDGGGGGTGVESEGLPFTLEGSRVVDVATGLRVRLTEPRSGRSLVVRHTLFHGGRNDAPEGGGDTALDLTIADGVACRFDHLTLHDWDVALRGRGPVVTPGGLTFDHNNLTRIRRQRFAWEGGIPAGLVWRNNNVWNPAGLLPPRLPAGFGDEDLELDPGYCPGADAEHEFALRVDSQLTSGNAPAGRIGAFEARCAGPSLLRDSRVTAVDEVRLDATLLVPPGRTLHLGPGARMEPSERFPDSGRFGALPLVDVAGALHAEGTESAPIQLGGATRAGGLRVMGSADATVTLRHVRLFRQSHGVRLEAGGALIEATHLIETGAAGLLVGPGVAPGRVRIRNSTVRGAAIGALIEGPAEVTGLRIEGVALGVSGIKVNGSRLDGSVVLRDNQIEGFTTGAGIDLWRAGPKVRLSGNRLARCAVGLRVQGGTPELGSGRTGNVLTDNSVALELRAGGDEPMLPCAPAAGPRIRGQLFSGNRLGVVVRTGAPLPDLGRGNDPGENRFLNSGEACIRNEAGRCGPVSAHGNLFGREELDRGLAAPPDVDAADPRAIDRQDAGTGAPEPLQVLPAGDGASWRVVLTLPESPVAVRLTLHDILGRRVRTPLEAVRSGTTRVTLHAADAAGRRLPAGIYFLALRVDGAPAGRARIVVTP